MGLQPCLSVNTKNDGSLVINMEILCSLPPHLKDKQLPQSSHGCRKRSGKDSRLRRKVQRSDTFSKMSEETDSSQSVNKPHADDEVSSNGASKWNDFSCQTQEAENELQLLELEIQRLNTEIHVKDSLIKEQEMKVSRMEDARIIKPHKQLSAVCVENTNVPPVAHVNSCECGRVQPVVQADVVARMKERERDLESLKMMMMSTKDNF